jgi:membrane-bound inhibitor of C-type lysozyme
MKIELNKVTKLSQLVAVVLFVFVYYYGFYLGRQVGIIKILGSKTNDVVFVCDGNKSIHAVFYERGVKVGFPKEPQTFLLQTISASGARFANTDESLVFWNKGNEAFIMRNNETDPNFNNCKTK